MQILYLNHNVARKGGTFYRAYQSARQLVRRGHEVTLLTISEQRRWGFAYEQRDGVQIVHTPDMLWGLGRTGWDPWDTLWRAASLRGRNWDIIHAWDCRPVVILPALYARRQSRGAEGKLVIDWCDWWGRGGTQAERPGGIAKLVYGPVETFFEEAFRTQADGTTVISQALRRRAEGLGVSPASIRVVPQGCDVDAPPATDRLAARQRLGLPAAQPVLLSVGALTGSEAALLFETLRLLFVRRPDCRFLMIGKHNAIIPDDIRRYDQFVETGFVSEDDLRDYTAACDALVTPLSDTIASRARWPSKVNPFLAAGRTTVITRVGDLAALLDRTGAAVVSGLAPDDIASSAIALLDDTALRDRCETRGREVAHQILAWPLIGAQLEGFYRDLRGDR